MEKGHYYKPIAALLNHCVTKGDSIYNTLRASGQICKPKSEPEPNNLFVLGERDDRYFKDLAFFPFDKEMSNSIDKAGPMRTRSYCC